MTAPCPHLARLENAKKHYRALREQCGALLTANDILHDRLTRYERIGARRFHEGEAWYTLVGTEVWFDNVLLRRALQQRDATIQRLTHLNAALKRVLAGEPQRTEVQP